MQFHGSWKKNVLKEDKKFLFLGEFWNYQKVLMTLSNLFQTLKENNYMSSSLMDIAVLHFGNIVIWIHRCHRISFCQNMFYNVWKWIWWAHAGWEDADVKLWLIWIWSSIWQQVKCETWKKPLNMFRTWHLCQTPSDHHIMCFYYISKSNR